eukprot:2402393-Rhodomonas_salina.2
MSCGTTICASASPAPHVSAEDSRSTAAGCQQARRGHHAHTQVTRDCIGRGGRALPGLILSSSSRGSGVKMPET